MLQNERRFRCDGIPVNKSEADRGNSKAMHNFAIFLGTGDGVSIDKKETAWYMKMPMKI